MSLLKLFFIYVKIGAILLGGGYVILPIITNEFVDKRKLVTNEEMLDYFALSQSLPGMIAANISMFIGYKIRGKLGAITAMLGIVFVPFWIIIILGTILKTAINNSYIQSALWGISISVIVLILLTIREMWKKSNKNLFFYFILVLSLILLLFVKLSPIITIIISVFCGLFIKIVHRRFQK